VSGDQRRSDREVYQSASLLGLFGDEYAETREPCRGPDAQDFARVLIDLGPESIKRSEHRSVRSMGRSPDGYEATATFPNGVSMSSAETYPTVAEATTASVMKLLDMPKRLGSVGSVGSSYSLVKRGQRQRQPRAGATSVRIASMIWAL
jgi:hypothetical protein